MSLLLQTEETATAAATTAHEGIAALKNLPLEDLLNRFIDGASKLAINIVIALIVFYVGKFIINKLYKLVSNIMTRRNIDTSLTTFVLSLIRILLYFILIVTVIGILGVETSSFLALFASAGVAIGMALSGTLQNFAGGVLILLLKPYRVGDFIEAQGFAGTVKEIQIFHTIIATADNKAIIIPNGGLSTGSINNASRESHRRVEWSINLSHGNDATAALATIKAMLLEDPRVVKDSINGMKGDFSPSVFLNEIGGSLVFIARAWTESGNFWGLYGDFNIRLYDELPAKGFTFPKPIMNVNLNN